MCLPCLRLALMSKNKITGTWRRYISALSSIKLLSIFSPTCQRLHRCLRATLRWHSTLLWFLAGCLLNDNVKTVRARKSRAVSLRQWQNLVRIRERSCFGSPASVATSQIFSFVATNTAWKCPSISWNISSGFRAYRCWNTVSNSGAAIQLCQPPPSSPVIKTGSDKTWCETYRRKVNIVCVTRTKLNVFEWRKVKTNNLFKWVGYTRCSEYTKLHQIPLEVKTLLCPFRKKKKDISLQPPRTAAALCIHQAPASLHKKHGQRISLYYLGESWKRIQMDRWIQI